MVALRLLALGLLTSVACSGDLPSGGGGGTDSGGGGAADAAVDAPKLVWIDAASGSGSTLPCEDPATPGNGEHNPGRSCFDGCHDHGFTLAGTLYNNATGNSAFMGATITIVDSNNQTLKLVTATNGNFFTKQAIAFPVLVMASSCPSAVQMTAAVAMTGRACNSCHVGGTNDQMHLP